MVLFVKSTQALRNLAQLFVRYISALMEELDIFSDEQLALQMLNIVKNFWSLLYNQHVVITHQAYTRYSAAMYEVLPSLASVYIDLFIAVYSTKSTLGKAAERLYSWLMFELNERCIQTALLEVCGCTTAGARLVLPVLRTVLSNPSDKTNNLDYLLHFLLLKRWSFVCTDLSDLIQVSSSIKAPESFFEWLVQCWPKAVENLPNEKSLRGRRISEFLLELDRQAIEELIDVFSQALMLVKQTSEREYGKSEVNKKSADQATTDQLFFIDKKGNNANKMPMKTGKQFFEKDQRETDLKKDAYISNTCGNKNKRHSDICMLSGHLDDRCSEIHETGTGSHKDSFIDSFVEKSASEQTELHTTVNMQPLKKKKLSPIQQDIDKFTSLLTDNNSKPQGVSLKKQDIRDTSLVLSVEADGDNESEIMDHDTVCVWQGTGRNVRVSQSQVMPEIIIDGTRSIVTNRSAQTKNSWKGKETGCSNDKILSATESQALKKYKANPKAKRNHANLSTDVDYTSSLHKDTPSSFSFQLPSEQLTVFSSEKTKVSTSYLNISAHSSFADQIIKKNGHPNPKVKRVSTSNFTETQSDEKHPREITAAAESFENTEIAKGTNTLDSSNTELEVALILSKIRKSESGSRTRKPECKTDTFCVKTRLRTKSEGMAQTDSVHKTRNRKSLTIAAESGFKDCLTPNRILRDKSPKHSVPKSKVQTKLSIKVKDSTAMETDSSVLTRKFRDNLGSPLKMYSRKDHKKIFSSTEDISIPGLTMTKHKSLAKTSGEPEKGRYFLRTNCSHRLLTTDTVCLSCSPSTKS
ncbi:hypothetical protein BsWGS_21201 [Bradybaena similaris]